jgi:hypothetical protein
MICSSIHGQGPDLVTHNDRAGELQVPEPPAHAIMVIGAQATFHLYPHKLFDLLRCGEPVLVSQLV